MAFGPRSQGRIAGYPIGEDQSAGLKAILQPADCSPGPVMPVHIRGPSAPRDRDSRCGGATAPRKIGMNSGYHLGALPDGGGKATIARAASFAKSLASLLEKEKVAYDVGAYRDARPSNLVRRDGRDEGCRSADALARFCLRNCEGRSRQRMTFSRRLV